MLGLESSVGHKSSQLTTVHYQLGHIKFRIFASATPMFGGDGYRFVRNLSKSACKVTKRCKEQKGAKQF